MLARALAEAVMQSAGVVWVRYTWDLQGRTFAAPVPRGYAIRLAAPAECRRVAEIAIGAYASDPIWTPMMASIRRRMTKRVEDAFGAGDSAFLCATDAHEPVAVSGVARSHWTQQNFLTGICVLPGHQRKRLGTCLLAASLTWLRDSGLPSAHVFTEEGSIADRSIYSRYGSTRIVGVEYPDPPTIDG